MVFAHQSLGLFVHVTSFFAESALILPRNQRAAFSPYRGLSTSRLLLSAFVVSHTWGSSPPSTPVRSVAVALAPCLVAFPRGDLSSPA